MGEAHELFKEVIIFLVIYTFIITIIEKFNLLDWVYMGFEAKFAAKKENQNISPIAISKAIDDNESATLPHIDENMASSTASNQDVGSNLDFSNDSSTGQVEENKGDPLRALTTSVSFGRFMTEPLNWEKWSSFSHNRILEDVKKYSRPGAVAEKKAFFEAHYKNFAAKKAANSPQKENQVPNYPPPLPNTTANISPIAISKAYSSIDDTRENESATLVDVPHFDESMRVESEIASNQDVGSSGTNLDISEINIDDNISSTGQLEEEITLVENKRIHIKDAADMDKLSRLKKPEISSLKSGCRYEEYKKLESPPKELAPGNLPKKTITDVMERKRSALQSLHLSMNFSPARNKNGTSKTLSKHNATKVLENEVKKSSQVLPRPENKRSKPVIDCSTNGSRKVALKSLSINHSEAPSACTKKPRPTTVPSTFSFKCDERAAKRKEFFQKLEQRCKVNETQTIQLQPKLKDKTRSEKNRLRCSTALEAQASTSETKAQSNNVQKVPPKTGRKPTPRLVQDTCFRSPWKSSSKPKNFIEINKKKLSSFMACLPAKKMQDSIG